MEGRHSAFARAIAPTIQAMNERALADFNFQAAVCGGITQDLPIPSRPDHHTKDSDCTVGPDGLCTTCLIEHGVPCPDCGATAFHLNSCTQKIGMPMEDELPQRQSLLEITGAFLERYGYAPLTYEREDVSVTGDYLTANIVTQNARDERVIVAEVMPGPHGDEFGNVMATAFDLLDALRKAKSIVDCGVFDTTGRDTRCPICVQIDAAIKKAIGGAK